MRPWRPLAGRTDLTSNAYRRARARRLAASAEWRAQMETARTTVTVVSLTS
ncbi:hypothetical protein ACFV9P_33680 [Streptomyces sp. NPDC059892]|uniref:hypothetical protein n=1 Tax=unclassified Streptomyces TaxID=2593676 RepID=UPI003652EB90